MNYSQFPFLQENSFAQHKILNLDIAEKYQDFKPKKAQQIFDCGRILFFNHQKHKETHEHRLQLDQMYTCKDRFCPYCNWRRSRKLALQSYEVLKRIQDDHAVRYLFLTLTVKNPRLVDTRETINAMMKGWQRMSQTVRYKNAVLGSLRALENHPQKDDPGFTHPHFHVLLIVPARYMQRGSDLYIHQKEWLAMWRKAMRLDYNPSVDIRPIRPKYENADPIASVVAETCKYPVKSTDLTSLTTKHFQIFADQMARIRNIAYGGIFKEYRKKLLLDDVEQGDLIHDLPQEDAILWETIERLRYEFRNGDYGLNFYLPVSKKEG